jgi:hypothetical protein
LESVSDEHIGSSQGVSSLYENPSYQVQETQSKLKVLKTVGNHQVPNISLKLYQFLSVSLLEEPDGHFRYPSWLLASLLVALYCCLYMYIRALDWSPSFQGCLLEPIDCLQDNLEQHLNWSLGIVDEGSANTANGYLYQV